MQSTTLRTAIGRYPHTKPLLSGRIRSDLVQLDFADIKPINRAFAPMVREERFDVSEMAIATFLQAKAFGKRLVLLPIVLAARFQHASLLCDVRSTIRGPSDLAGRRVGVRAYSQTTGVWLRGILADEYGVRPEPVRWITFEDAHVPEYRDPPWAERAAPGKDLVAMVHAGELDAIIVGSDPPDDPALRPVFPDPEGAAEAFWQKHHFVSVNHLLTVRQDLARDRPDLVAELTRMFREAKAASPSPAGGRDPYPFGRAALQPALALALRYTFEQGLLPRPLTIDEVWEGLPGDA